MNVIISHLRNNSPLKDYKVGSKQQCDLRCNWGLEKILANLGDAAFVEHKLKGKKTTETRLPNASIIKIKVGMSS